MWNTRKQNCDSNQSLIAWRSCTSESVKILRLKSPWVAPKNFVLISGIERFQLLRILFSTVGIVLNELSPARKHSINYHY